MNLREYAAQTAEDRTEEQPNRFDGMGSLMQEQERSKADKKRAEEIVKSYNRARVNAESIVSEILKGCKGAKNPFFLLYRSAECIGLLTDDNGFLAKQVKDAIIEEYSQRQSNASAMEFEAECLSRELETIAGANHEQTPNLSELIAKKKKRLEEVISLKDN